MAFCLHNRCGIRIAALSAVLALFLICPAASHALFGGKVTHFSADQVEIAPDGSVTNTTKLYVTPDGYRMDGLPGGGQPGVPKADLTILAFRKQNKQYIYNHDKKLYFEDNLDEASMASMLKEMKQADQERVLGEEEVSGYDCVKKEVTSTYTVMGMKNQITTVVWQSDRFEMPLRVRQTDGHMTEMRNIDTGKPDRKLFRRLPGYRKVDNIMAVMGMDMGAMAEADAMPAGSGDTAPSENIQEMDMERMMAGMKQAMGDDVDPEQMKQMEQIMAQAMQQAKQTRSGQGAAAGLWQVIPKRAGDAVMEELKTVNMYNVVMGSNSSLDGVFSYYEKQLKPDGWQDGGRFIQEGKGFFNLMKGDRRLTISWADDPGGRGNYALFYSLKLSGPDL